MKLNPTIFAVFVLSLGALWLGINAMPAAEPADGFHLVDFGKIPVQENGRLMPFDTYARTKLMLLSHRQSTKKEVVVPGANEVKAVPVSAVEFALSAMLLKRERNNDFHDMHCFRIDNDELLDLLNLKPNEKFGLFFKLDDFIQNKQFWKRVGEIRENGGPRKDDLLEKKIAELYQKIQTVHIFAELRDPKIVMPKVANDKDVAEVPWMSLVDAIEAEERGDMAPNKDSLEYVSKLLYFRSQGNATKFNQTLDEYLSFLRASHPSVFDKDKAEVFFNHFAPYYQCIVLFVGALILALVSWVTSPKPLRFAAWSLGVLTLVVYTWTLIMRIWISGYAPVTNLYSSAVFIGWGCAFLCLILELVLRNGIGTIVAAVTGIVALIIAHNLLEGDSMGKVVAVLESNFWLSTHVICITLGYTATFVAGFLGIGYVLLGAFTTILRREAHITLGKVIYGVVCFAMFLSFVGTVLGGIWADQSWGRFWGWDPKENGALLIVIWNAIILHARWGGMVKPRGVALLAIAGNVVTAWSWFGTNLLGVGLHSYGFMQGAMVWLLVWAAFNAAIIAIGLMPLASWKSFQVEKTPPADGKLQFA